MNEIVGYLIGGFLALITMKPVYEECFENIEYTIRVLNEDIYNFNIEEFDEVVTDGIFS